MKVYQINVRADQPSYTVRVGGRTFSKAEATLVHEVDLTDELRASPLLDVHDLTPVDPVTAPAADAPADEPGVSADTAAEDAPDAPKGKRKKRGGE